MKKEDFVTKCITEISRLGEKYGKHKVYSDFVYMSACALANVTHQPFTQERENKYLSIITGYTPDEQCIFPKLLSYVVLALEDNPEQDFLGNVYCSLNLNNSSLGQIFTPFHVSKLMAEMVIFNQEVNENKKEISVCDPCCGTGTMLIAVRSIMLGKDKLMNLKVVGQDVDSTVALSAYVQLSLLGVKGCIRIGNSITDNFKDEDCWYTPMTFIL